jgi:hypothetical protein
MEGNKMKDVKEVEFDSTQEMAGWLKISRTALWDHCRKGLIPYFKIGGAVRFDRAAVWEALVERQKAMMESKAAERKVPIAKDEPKVKRGCGRPRKEGGETNLLGS